MKIKTVHYMATMNLGNYSNERIGFTAQIEENESLESVVEALRQKVRDCALPNTSQLYQEIRERKNALEHLEHKLQNAKKQWELTADFLRTQGIKSDIPTMPQFTNLLPQIEDESVTEGEIEDDEEDEDRFF